MGTEKSQDFTRHLSADLPESWQLHRLDDICSFANGLWKGERPPLRRLKVLRNTNFNNDGTLDFADIAELDVQQSHYASRSLVTGDIILERSGGGPTQPVGRVVFFDRDEDGFSFSNFTTRLRVVDTMQTAPKFLLYYLLFFYDAGFTNELQKRTTGIRNLMFADYQGVLIPFPPLPEQCRIAAVLNAIQDAIAAQEDVIAAARQFKRSLMQRLFTYGPGREPAPTKETEIGEIPAHWEVRPLKYLADIDYGIQAAVAHMKDASIGVPILTNVNISLDGDIDLSTLRYYPLSDRQKDKLLHPGDVLFNWRSGSATHVGKTAYFELQQPYTFSSFILRFKPKGYVGSQFLTWFFRHLHARGFFSSRRDQSSVNSVINASSAAELPVAFPADLAEQSAIVGDICAADAKIAAEEDRKTALEALFKSMLHQLMTGQIRLLTDEGLPPVI